MVDSDNSCSAIIKTLDEHHKWFMSIVKPEHKDAVEGYYHILRLELFHRFYPSSHPRVGNDG